MSAEIDPHLWQKLMSNPVGKRIAVRVYPNQRSDFEIIEAYLATKDDVSFASHPAQGYISLVATGLEIERLAEHNAVQRIELDAAVMDAGAAGGPPGQPVDVLDIEPDFSIDSGVTAADPRAIGIGRPIPLDEFESAKNAAERPDADQPEVDTDSEED